jgi:D-alanyl-D-alanine carboxypeptidase
MSTLLVALALASLQEPPDDPRAWLAAEAAARGIPGLSAAVVRAGEVVLEVGIGSAAIEPARPATARTVYPLWSVAKVFTSVAVMRAVEREELALDAPVADALAELPEELGAITLRQALAHTSGLRNFFDAPEWKELAPDVQAELAPLDVLGIVAGMRSASAPGERFAYSQSGYVLAGALLEHAGAAPFATLLERDLFTPLGMETARHGALAALALEHAAVVYERVDGELRTKDLRFEPFVHPAAGLNASVRDLVAFAVALDAGRVLPRAALDVLWTESTPRSGPPSGYGLGWVVDALDGHRRAGHEGGGAAWFWHFPDERLSVIVLTNLNGGRNDELVDALARRFL